MSEENTKAEEKDSPSLLHRLGNLGSTVGKKAPKKKSTRYILQGGFAFLIFAFLVFTVVTQWSELREKGVEFNLIWLLPAILAMLVYYTLSASLWGLILKFMGTPVKPGEAQKIWAQPLLVRYIPGSVLFVLARVLMAEKVGVPRRISTAGIVYEQAVSIAAALTIACYFLIDHPDLQDNPLRWVPALITPLLVIFLHPRIFGPVSRKALTALGREPLPNTMSFGGVLTIYACYVLLWGLMGLGVYFAARSVHFLAFNEIATVAASQMIGFLAAVVSAVTPAGLGVRDAAFAWAVKVALPSGSFGVGAAIAIAVRATQTVVELIYVGIVTLLAKRTQSPADEDVVELLHEAQEAARAE
jgi:glycosyltransferase 2 family protein